MTTVERLEELLNQREREIESLKSEIESLKGDWRWVIHRRNEGEESLPVPRLENRCTAVDGDWYRYVWTYSLVYRHLLGHTVYVPLGSTSCTGGRGKPIGVGGIEEPFREFSHIRSDRKQLSLRAFLIVEDGEHSVVQEIK